MATKFLGAYFESDLYYMNLNTRKEFNVNIKTEPVPQNITKNITININIGSNVKDKTVNFKHAIRILK